jgi:hypothetical protein
MRESRPYGSATFDGSGADFMPEYKDYIIDRKTIIGSPHKGYGPEANALWSTDQAVAEIKGSS